MRKASNNKVINFKEKPAKWDTIGVRNMVFVWKVEQFVILLFRQLAEKQSVLSLKSLQMAVFVLTNTHRSRLWRDDEVSNSNGYKLRRVGSSGGWMMVFLLLQIYRSSGACHTFVIRF
jgi:hypothetical protein